MSTLNMALARIINRLNPTSVLLLGPSAPASWKALDLGRRPEVDTVRDLVDGTLPPDKGRFDLVLVGGLIERMDRDAGGRLLGALRDLHARTLLVQIPHESDAETTTWSLTVMLAYGFERVGTFGEFQETADLYRFSLEDYKKTPDWLSPTNWAHPHLWKP